MTRGAMMEALFNYFWLIAILTNIINVVICWNRVQPHIKKKPSLRAGYIRFLWGYLIGMSLPWVVMGVGLLTQQVASLPDYFYPNRGNPCVISWWISIWIVVFLYSYWFFFKDGANQLIKYPGLIRGKIQNPETLKISWCLALFGGMTAHIFIFLTAK